MIIVDINTISNFRQGERFIRPAEILKIAREKGTLIYDSTKGNPPVLTDDDQKISLVNYNDLSEKDKEAVLRDK